MSFAVRDEIRSCGAVCTPAVALEVEDEPLFHAASAAQALVRHDFHAKEPISVPEGWRAALREVLVRLQLVSQHRSQLAGRP
jgi:hypothetical protein